MDETLIRDLLDRVMDNEPPLGPVVERAVAAGRRVRRRRRILGAAGAFGCSMLAGAVLASVLVPGPGGSRVSPPVAVGNSTPAPSAGTSQPVTLYSWEFGPRFTLAVYKETPRQGQALILFTVRTTDPSEDWTATSYPVRTYYRAGLVSATADRRYGADRAYEFQYTPGGAPSGLCMGLLGSGIRPGTLVALEPCGAGPRTLWIAAGGALVSGASAGSAVPEALSYPGGEYPTDLPRPQLRTGPLIPQGSSVQQWMISPRPSATPGEKAASAGLFIARSGEVLKVDPATGAVTATIPVAATGTQKEFFVGTPDGRTIYLISPGDNMVIPIDTATGKVVKTISVGDPAAAVMSPKGGVLYVGDSDGVTPIDTATNTPGVPISVGGGVFPSSMTITPNGAAVYVAMGKSVVPISTATNKAGGFIRVASSGIAAEPFAMAPDGATLYIATTTGEVIPLGTATNTMGAPISVAIGASAATGISITPDGSTAYLIHNDASTAAVVPVDLAARTAGKAIPVPEEGGHGYAAAQGIVVSPDGKTVYAGILWGPLVPISTATGTTEPYLDRNLGLNGMATGPGGTPNYVCTWKDGVLPVATATFRSAAPLANAGTACEAIIYAP